MHRSAQSVSPFWALLVLSLLSTSRAWAADFASHARQWPAVENPKCTCRFKGEHLPLGSQRCLQTPDGPRTAECVTEQNVTSWRPGKEACVQASLFTPVEFAVTSQ